MEEQQIKDRLRTYILEEFIKDKEYPLRDDEPLISGGVIDSFSLVHLSVFIEEKLGVSIPDTDLTVESMDTLNDMVARIVRESQ